MNCHISFLLARFSFSNCSTPKFLTCKTLDINCIGHKLEFVYFLFAQYWKVKSENLKFKIDLWEQVVKICTVTLWMMTFTVRGWLLKNKNWQKFKAGPVNAVSTLLSGFTFHLPSILLQQWFCSIVIYAKDLFKL